MKYLRWTVATTAVATLAAALLTPSAAARSGLESFYGQPVTWHTCQRDPDDEEGAALDRAGARCTELNVPLDYAHPGGRTVTLALSMVAASDTAHRIGPLIFNLGGPGVPVFGRVVDAAAAMGATGARFDLIGLDPRFTGRSSPVDCQWQSSWIPRSAGTSVASFARVTALSARLATQCAARHADVLPFASSAAIARDLDVVRGALGAPKLSYLGYSYGGYIGALYTQLFPERADRIVFDSTIDPDDPGVHVKGDNGPAREAALTTWAGWAAQRDATYHLGTTATAVRALIDELNQSSAVRPLRVGQFLVDDTVFPALLVDPLADDGAESADQLARFIRTLADARDSAPVQPAPDLAEALASILTGAGSQLHSGQTVISCMDEAVPRDPAWYYHEIQRRRAGSPLFAGINFMSPCAFWPTRPPQPTPIHNPTPVLIVHADGDINAIPAFNQAMHRALPASRLLTLDSARTHGVYLFRGSPCIDNLVNTYLNTATLPPTDTHCPQGQ